MLACHPLRTRFVPQRRRGRRYTGGLHFGWGQTMRCQRATGAISAFTGLCLGAALLLSSPAAMAQWKWKDRNGQTHISDLPPPRDIPDKDVLQRPSEVQRRPAAAAAPASAPPASASSAAKPRTDPEIEARRTRAEQEQKAKAKAEEERLATQRAENCQRARQSIAGLESGIRLARVNDKGEREILDDKARAEEMRRARDVVNADCR